MWKEFSVRYIRENRTSGALLAGAAFLSSLFLSLLCSIAYNLWADYGKQQAAGQVAKEAPGALFLLYGIVLFFACLALILLLHNAFAVSMGSRIHQLGILKSVGATPGQIRSFLLQEAFVLCTFPVLAGTGAGVGLCALFIRRVIDMGRDMHLNIQYDVAFEYHILVLVISLGTAFFTILLSAWIPARKLSRLSPMEAIFGEEGPEIKKMRAFRLTSRCFGVYGELARKSLYARRKSMRLAGLALFLSFLGFLLFLSGETISGLSTQHTYFARFRDTWDYMLTVDISSEKEREDTDSLLTALRELPGIESVISYRLVDTKISVPEQMLGEKLQKEGPETLLGDAKQVQLSGQTAWQVDAHFYILDDQSFQKYCASRNISSDTGVVAVNLLWDDKNSDYKNRRYLPFLKEAAGSVQLDETAGSIQSGENAGTKAESETSGEGEVSLHYDVFADTIPDIREALEQKALNLVISQTAFSGVEGLSPTKEMYYNLRTEGNLSKQQSDAMESSVAGVATSILQSDDSGKNNFKSVNSESTSPEPANPGVRNFETGNMESENSESGGTENGYILENRLEDEQADASARKGLRIVMGVLAGILACVGIAGILSTTLGQIYQRKKEFARYVSIGVSPDEIKKMLFMEALFIVGRPFLLALLIDIPVTVLLLHAAPVTAGELLGHLPWMPVLLLLAVTAAVVAIAYMAAAGKICRQNIVETLKDDAII